MKSLSLLNPRLGSMSSWTLCWAEYSDGAVISKENGVIYHLNIMALA
jgi:hypothetical protein